jgi:GT2 family glycosyltransferase|tara:strand:- start:1503 stop:2321 length:819 start_codon:yes stop_codon:yes gene_type:complete
MTEVSIVIVSYNTCAAVERCIEAIRDQEVGCKYEIIVVDNASKDGTVERIRSRWSDVSVVVADKNLGFARACNLGIRQSSSEFILLLNSDTVVSADAIDALLNKLLQDKRVAVVGPRLVDLNGVTESSFGSTLTPFTEFFRLLVEWCVTRNVRFVLSLIRLRASRSRFTAWVSGACLLVRRNVAAEVGFLDERYFMYFEDIDFCSSIRKLGYQVLFTSDVEIVHARGQSAKTAPEATRLAYQESHLAFYEKHLPLWVPVLRVYLRFRPDRSF